MAARRMMFPDSVEFGVRVTLSDQLRFAEWTLDRPALRRRRLSIRAGVIFVVPLASCALGVGISAVQDGVSPVSALMDPGFQRQAAVVIVGSWIALVALFSALHVFRRPVLRRRLRRLLVERPGIDPTDPALVEAVQIRLGPDGFESKTQAVSVILGWAAIKGLEDAGTLLVIKTGRLSGYLIPKNDLSLAQLDTLKSLVNAYRSTEGWHNIVEK